MFREQQEARPAPGFFVPQVFLFWPAHSDRAAQSAEEVVAHGDSEHDPEPEESGHYYHLREPGAVLHVHEEQYHQHRLGHGDGQRHQRVQRESGVELLFHIELRGVIRGDRTDHQRSKDQKVDSNWDYVIRHSFTYPKCDVRLIKYSSGNRKIHTISTKCQYNPKFSMGV